MYSSSQIALHLIRLAVLQTNGSASSQDGQLERQIWDVVSNWQPYTACALLAAGFIFAIYGWRISKVLAVINVAAVGGFVGHFAAGQFEQLSDLAAACTIGLAGALGALCIWQTRHGVSLLAGAAGGVIGSALVYALNLPEEQSTAWISAGFLVGFVTFALFAFIVYKVAAVLFSSVEGAALLAAGTLSLLSTQPSIADKISESLQSNTYMLPLILGVPTVISIIVQKVLLKRGAGWSIDN